MVYYTAKKRLVRTVCFFVLLHIVYYFYKDHTQRRTSSNDESHSWKPAQKVNNAEIQMAYTSTDPPEFPKACVGIHSNLEEFISRKMLKERPLKYYEEPAVAETIPGEKSRKFDPPHQKYEPDTSICEIGFFIKESDKPTDSHHALTSWMKRLCGGGTVSNLTEIFGTNTTEGDPEIDPNPFLSFPDESRATGLSQNWFFMGQRQDDTTSTLEIKQCHKLDGSGKRCCEMASMLRLIKETLPGKKWYMIADVRTFIVPENLASLVSRLDPELPILVGSEHFYLKSGTEEGKLLRGPSKYPYGPLDQVEFLKNTKRIHTNAGFIISKQMLNTLVDSINQVENDCLFIPKTQINHRFPDITSIAQELGGKIVTYPGLHSDSPEKVQYGSRPLQVPPISWYFSTGSSRMHMMDYFTSMAQPKPVSDFAIDDINFQLSKPSIERMQDYCSDIIDFQQRTLIQVFSSLLENINRVAIIGFPDHSNKGDSAIWVGERLLLAKLGVKVVYICETMADFEANAMISKLGNPKTSAILLHGGGNFGDLYTKHQELRNLIVDKFHQYKVVAFPQTVYFQHKNFLNKVRDMYSQHPDLTLVARDFKSYKFLQKHFDTHQLRLTPDVAFMIGSAKHLRTPVKVDILIHQREDQESSGELAKDVWSPLSRIKAKSIKQYSQTLVFTTMDWIGIDPDIIEKIENHDRKAWRRVVSGLDFLSRGKLVITNRLHGHILLTLLGKPHILVDNSYGKIFKYYKAWTNECPLAAIANDKPQAIELAKSFFEQGRWAEDSALLEF